jgi:purine-nucleoside phosphorylase
MNDLINSGVDYIRANCHYEPTIALVLGSGLGEYAETLEDAIVLPYEAIPGFFPSGVLGHAGKLIIGKKFGVTLAVMQGRNHYYEGHSQKDITLPIRILNKLGVQSIILTNAAGGVNLDFCAGDIMVIEDHINYSGSNPLIGKNYDEFGERFPDMSKVYTPELRSALLKATQEADIQLKSGIYMMFSGPSFETPAEIRMARVLGADAVGMSTVPDAITARHCGMKIVGISCITNMAAGILDQPLSHKEVFETAEKSKHKFANVLDILLRII